MTRSRLALRPPNLSDVAIAADVSVSTAARVLRGDNYPVDPELGRRVREAAEKIGYVRNVLARSLRGGPSTMVGLVVGDMLDPFYGEVAEVVTKRAETQYSMAAIVCNMQRDPLLELKYCQQLWEHRVGGLILAGGGFDQWSHFERLAALIQNMEKSGVVIASLSPRGLDIPTFTVDNERLGHFMASELTRRGHRHIGVMLGAAQSEATQHRLRGATAHLAKTGATFRLFHAEYNAAAGASIISTLVAEEPHMTAVMVGSDAMAVGVLNRLTELGRSVPGDISVLSAGNTLYGQWSRPRLTTIDLSLTQCGSAALDFVAARVMNAKTATQAAKFPFQLVDGETLGNRRVPK